MWSNLLTFLIFFVVWYSLMRFILPALGIPTCMTGACQLQNRERKEETQNDGKQS